MFRLRLICTVALARVFFHCHYFGDTVIGAIVGTTVAYSLKAVDVESVAVLAANWITPVDTN